jgi:hypothetical protein
VALREGQRGEARRPLDQIGVLDHELERVLDVADHTVEADAREPVLPLELHAALHEQDDVGVGPDERAGELGVATAETDVDRAVEVTTAELLGVATVDEHRTGDERRFDLVERHRLGECLLVEQVAVLSIEERVVHEVPRRGRLALGDECDERVLVERAERVVGGALLADGGRQLGRQVLATGGPGTVGREDARVVGERHQA